MERSIRFVYFNFIQRIIIVFFTQHVYLPFFSSLHYTSLTFNSTRFCSLNFIFDASHTSLEGYRIYLFFWLTLTFSTLFTCTSPPLHCLYSTLLLILTDAHTALPRDGRCCQQQSKTKNSNTSNYLWQNT